jgi:2-hydroxychromene-2-carboxylate isomerase
MPARIATTLYTDPGCPWAYSAIPPLRVIEWRYGSQLDWRLVVIGLTESSEQYVARGYTPLRSARGWLGFRRFGMPFAPSPKPRVSATARACRAIVAARLRRPGSEWPALRALQLANFSTPLVLEDDEHVSRIVAAAIGVEPDVIRTALDAPDVDEAYQRDRAEARTASGSPSELQRKTATSDGPVRYTAPSVVFEREGVRLEAGGWQTIEAYDVLVANLDPAIERRQAPSLEEAGALIEAFPTGLTTQEVTALLVDGNDAPDRRAAELALLDLVGDGRAVRLGLGDDALWVAPEAAADAEAILREASSPRELAHTR